MNHSWIVQGLYTCAGKGRHRSIAATAHVGRTVAHMFGCGWTDHDCTGIKKSYAMHRVSWRDAGSVHICVAAHGIYRLLSLYVGMSRDWYVARLTSL